MNPQDEAVLAFLHNQFTYHPPHGTQAQRYQEIRDKAYEFALFLNERVPDCADKSAAIRKLRECVMTANAAIACNEKLP